MSLHRMPQGFVRVNRVLIPATLAGPGQVSCLTEVKYDALDCALGDPYANGNVTPPD